MEQISFFAPEAPAAPAAAGDRTQPLPARMRPETLDDFFGQEQLIGEGRVLRRMIEEDRPTSMIFWGPPGVGKTTLASIIARRTRSAFIEFSAVTSGIKEIRAVMEQAEKSRRMGTRTILFVDEIHRFNKAQQDAFLPYVEKGSIILIGATTENPSFEVNGALLSRCRVFVLHGLTEKDMVKLLQRAIRDPRGFGDLTVETEDGVLESVAAFSGGDARSALSVLEMLVLNSEQPDGHVYISRETLSECLEKKSLLYDKQGEEHYNLISALHKSMRNSDPDAAVYWLARMLEAGEDPMYIARRCVRFASEDVGLADPRAVEMVMSCAEACKLIGMPECSVHLTQAVVYLSLAPKSNAMEKAYLAARDDALGMLAEPVPLNIRNAPTKLMAQLDYGKGYQYAHDYAEKVTAMQCLPDSLKDKVYYEPTEEGVEGRFKERNRQIKEWKQAKRSGK